MGDNIMGLIDLWFNLYIDFSRKRCFQRDSAPSLLSPGIDISSRDAELISHARGVVALSPETIQMLSPCSRRAESTARGTGFRYAGRCD